MPEAESWGTVQAASVTVAQTLTASLSQQILSIIQDLEDERSDFNDDLFALEQLFLSREGEVKNLMSVMGAAHEDISLLNLRLQMDEKVIKENSATISDLHSQLSLMSKTGGDSDFVLDGQVHELRVQVQTLETKLALLTELAERDQRKFEQDKAILQSQLSELSAKCRAGEEIITGLRIDKSAQGILGLAAQHDTSDQTMSGLELKLQQCKMELATGSEIFGIDPGHFGMTDEQNLPESSIKKQHHVIASMLAQHEAQQEEIMRLTGELKRIASHVADFNVIATPEKVGPGQSPRGHSSLLVGDRMFLTVANVGSLGIDKSRSEIQLRQSHSDSESNIHESQSDQSQDV